MAGTFNLSEPTIDPPFGGRRERYRVRTLTLCFAAVCINQRLVQGELGLQM